MDSFIDDVDDGTRVDKHNIDDDAVVEADVTSSYCKVELPRRA